ncbi:MAG: DUF1566 domain-containing protein [Desulfobacteraceae bacterium]|nr:DUF1566 domain-containing protein [Desulfobacteraceae bacterium]
MERENYYLLLELSVDPPEKNPDVINEAIKNKQTQWSRYRNHPTKSIQAKQYIGLIPEIKKTLTDPDLRDKEAQAAKEILSSKDKEKFSKVDRHIKLLMSKGPLTKTEISGLAKLDNIGEPEINKRVQKEDKIFKIDREIKLLTDKGPVSEKKIAGLAKKHSIAKDKLSSRIKKAEEEKFSEIDNYLTICSKKGYTTEEEIEKLSKVYSVKESLILSRIECPIKPEHSKKFARVRPLDKTLEKLINDNLKIVGKSSLYDFLDAPTDTDAEILHEIAKEKEMEIRKVAQKDALTTASAALAGHCIVLFKSKKARQSYDLSTTRTRVSELDYDLAAAGLDGKVRVEYFEILARQALRIGMEIDEAIDYIKDYCEEQKWSLEEKKKWIIIKKKKILIWEKWTVELNPKAPSFWIFVGSLLFAVIILFSGISMTGSMIQSARLRSAYKSALSSAESQSQLERKAKTLQNFVNRHGESEYAPEIKEKLAELRKQIEKRDFDETMQDSKKLTEKKNFEKLHGVYDLFLKKHPKSKHSAKIRELLEDIPNLIDDRDYEDLQNVASGDFAQRIKAYNQYLTDHPKGRHIEDVQKLVLNMVQQYYDKLKRELKLCEKSDEWNKCVQLCNAFIQKFDGTDQAEEVRGFVITYNKRKQYKADLDQMREFADQRGTDFASAKDIYKEYMDMNPEAPSYLKDKVAQELARLDRAQKRYLEGEKEWGEVVAYCNNLLINISKRTGKLENFVQRDPSGRHVEKAEAMLMALMKKKAVEDERIMAEQERNEWRKILALGKNSKIKLTDNIQEVEKYIKKYPSGAYVKNAKSLLRVLLNKKKRKDDYIRKEEERKARAKAALQNIKAFAQRSGRRFVDNGNGTVSDTKTGLMWTALNSGMHLGRCVDYHTGLDYVNSLKTGGHRDWRLPSVNELITIYKNKPYYPAGGARWFWSSELVEKAWKKWVIIVTSRQEAAVRKELVKQEKCGTVHAVRK